MSLVIALITLWIAFETFMLQRRQVDLDEKSFGLMARAYDEEKTSEAKRQLAELSEFATGASAAGGGTEPQEERQRQGG